MRRSPWEPGTVVQNTDTRASSRQIAYLDKLNHATDRPTMYAAYLDVCGIAFVARRPERRFRDLTRGEASALIEALT